MVLFIEISNNLRLFRDANQTFHEGISTEKHTFAHHGFDETTEVCEADTEGDR